MTQSILLRRSVNAGTVPAAGDFDTQTFIINQADGILFWRDTSGTVQSLNLRTPGGNSVAYDKAQSLNGTQRIQAKANIAALGTGYQYISGNASITAAQAGCTSYLASGSTITLPPIANTQNGDMFMFHSWSSTNYIKGSNNENLFVNGVGITTLNLRQGQSVLFVSSTSQWLAFGVGPAESDVPNVNIAQAFSAGQIYQFRKNGRLPGTTFFYDPGDNTQLGVGDVGTTLFYDVSRTVYLPPFASCVLGDEIEIFVRNNGSTVTVRPAPGDSSQSVGNIFTDVAALPLTAGTYTIRHHDGNWRVHGTAVHEQNAVLMDRVQSTTEGQRQNARYNIHAAPIHLVGRANLIINNCMNVATDSGGAVQGGGGFPAEQWCLSGTPSGIQAQQVGFPFPSQPDVTASIKVSASSAFSVGSGDNVCLFQPIEGANLACLAYGSSLARPVTVAFMLRANYTGVGYFSLVNLNQNDGNQNNTYRSIIHRLSFTANTDTFLLFVLNGDTARQLLNSSAQMLQARFTFCAGSTFQGSTQDAWVTGNYLAGTDISNIGATAGNFATVSSVVLTPGVINLAQSNLSLFGRRYDEDEDLCNRYFEVLSVTAITTNYIHYWFKKNKRAVGTASIRSGSLNGGAISWYNLQNIRLNTAAGGASDVAINANARM